MPLKWTRDPATDYETATGCCGVRWSLSRTAFDVSRLRRDGEVISNDASTGSHEANRALAEKLDAEQARRAEQDQ